MTDEKTSALIATAVTAFVAPFLMSAVNIALPQIQSEFHLSAVALSWVATSYILAAAVCMVPAGKLADIHGRRKLFVLGSALLSLTTGAVPLATDAAVLIGLRVVQGVGGAIVTTNGVAILTSVYPARERGMAMGVLVAAVYVGLSVGPFVGGMLVRSLGWRSVFIVSALLGLLALWLTVANIKGEWAEAEGEPFDLLGSLIYGASLVSLMYGLTLLPSRPGIWLAGAGLAGLAAFTWWELRCRYPVLEVRLLAHNRVLTFSNLAALINYAAIFSVTFIFSLYLQYVRGMSPHTAGLVLVAQPLTQAVFSPLAGRLSDRFDSGRMASLGMAVTALALFSMHYLRADTPLWAIVAFLAVQGLGTAIFSSPNMNAVMGSVEPVHYGVASGAVATMRSVGASLSMAISAMLFSLVLGGDKIGPHNLDGFIYCGRLGFMIFGVLCAVGVVFSLARGKVAHNA